MSEIQKELLKAYKKLKKVLDDNKIEFMADGGTIIGALRHKGFIPGDDDMDLIIREEDIERFEKVINNTEGVTLKNFKGRNQASFYKVCFEDKFVMNGREESYLKIDVFILFKERKFTFKQNFKRVFFTGLLDFKNFANTKGLSGIVPFTKAYMKKVIRNSILAGSVVSQSSGYIYEDVNSGDPNKNTNYVYDQRPVTKEFEDTTIPVPYNAKKTMFIKYGDIMVLPPIEEQVVHGTEVIKK